MKRCFVLATLAAAAHLVLAAAHPATAQTAEQLEQQYGREAMAQALDAKRRYDLYGVHFEVGQATIQPQSQSLLDDIAEVMKSFPTWRLEIVGHTDAAGDPAQNELLSRARADAVMAALVQRGIAEGRLVPQGMGEAQPVASNDTPEGRALNRRVELVRTRAAAEHPGDLGRRHRLVQHQRLQSGGDGLQDAQHRPDRPGRCPVHRLVRAAELHGRARRLHHGPVAGPHRPDQGRPARSARGPEQVGPDHRRPAQAARLRHRPVRQEPSRRPQRAPADGARLRRVLRQPLPPQRRGGAREHRLPEESRVQGQFRPARRAALLRHRPRRGRRGPALRRLGQAEVRGHRAAHRRAHGDGRPGVPDRRGRLHRQGAPGQPAVLRLVQLDPDAHLDPSGARRRGQDRDRRLPRRHGRA